LVGGLIGAGVAHANIDAIQWNGLNKTLIAIVLSPTLGLMLTMAIMLVTSWLGVRASASESERAFRGLHLVSAGAYSLGHGLNDAQKTMGIITVLLYSTGYLHGDFHVPHWVALSCYVAIGLGTLSGGWRIIETMGTRITKLNQHQGFSASLGGSIMLFAASYLGIPVSTTHTITGCVIGAGAARRASAVRWGIARNVMVAWLITIPASATVAALFYWLISGYAARALLAVAVMALAIFAIVSWREFRLGRDSYGRTAAVIATLGFLLAALVIGYAALS
jgi:PiT family inorganic phosphate transporter